MMNLSSMLSHASPTSPTASWSARSTPYPSDLSAMSGNKKRPTSWRCKNAKQAKDKASIYNSREWKELRIQKLRAQPLCEKCLADGRAAGVAGGWIRSAHCVHHITPIETANTMEEMRRLAFNPANLMSLCDECHHKIHEEMRSFDPANVKARAEARQARWADNIVNRFINNKTEDNNDN